MWTYVFIGCWGEDNIAFSAQEQLSNINEAAAVLSQLFEVNPHHYSLEHSIGHCMSDN